MSLVTSVVSFFADKFLGSSDSDKDDEKSYREKERKKEATKGFVDRKWKKIMQQTRDANKRVDTKGMGLPKKSQQSFLLDLIQPLEKRKMMTIEKLKNIENVYRRNNYANLEKHDSYQQLISLNNIAQNFSIEEDSKDFDNV
tara:strand:- start:619 stop:1044 length:426 start_codon:yes stop_codon:yes gene_type:complete